MQVRLSNTGCSPWQENSDQQRDFELVLQIPSEELAMDIMGRKSEAIYARYRIVAEGEKISALLRMQRKSVALPERVVPIPSVAVQ